MKICFSLFCITFCFVFSSKAQHHARLNLAITPSTIVFTEIRYAIKSGLEYRCFKNWYLLAETAIPTRSIQSSMYQSNPKFNKLVVEIRHKHLDQQAWYYGLQFGYTKRATRFLTPGSYRSVEEDSLSYSFDQASVQSSIFTATAQLGLIGKLVGKVYVEAFAGLGYRAITTHYSDQINLVVDKFTSTPKCGPLIRMDNALYLQGTTNRVQINLGVRLFTQLF